MPSATLRRFAIVTRSSHAFRCSVLGNRCRDLAKSNWNRRTVRSNPCATTSDDRCTQPDDNPTIGISFFAY